ncbi:MULTISPECIES: hypothetical protein [Chryseobacterium]|uniref:Uncharacterized protein n=1 Tax=Chryseobacterium taihuense TaxID=1141221 RepID=A0A4U8W9C6_9FLAO|nr:MULTISPECIES: hypothetical protein [Chryseobacterium]QQV03800.1 hypothetical protein I6I61_05545 [Chryseobacterium sp. FDAARGOS 1104]VFB02857.1 Uncharacterised protein [Chryseobacterium taihuense]
MKKILFLFTIMISVSVFSQQATIFKINKYRVAELNEKIQETSGLNIFNTKLYTFNDSGNTSEIFELDPKTGEIVSSFEINAENKDWEALTNDGKNFYIGDFGNNAGTRKDLKIYRVPFSDTIVQNDSVKIISFEYPEQNDFSSKNGSTDFDAEAMIYLNGKIHLFTKEWASKATSHYIIDPEISDRQKAVKTEVFQTNFLVTDASYFDKKLYLIGYTKKTEVFLEIFNETKPGVFFNENPKRYFLGSALSIGQIEGIAVDENGIYISGEKFRSPVGGERQSLYFIPQNKLKD